MILWTHIQWWDFLNEPLILDRSFEKIDEEHYEKQKEWLIYGSNLSLEKEFINKLCLSLPKSITKWEYSTNCQNFIL